MYFVKILKNTDCFYLFRSPFLSPGCNNALGLFSEPLPLRVVAPLEGYDVVACFFKYVSAYAAFGCTECAHGTLLWCADDGAEYAVGNGVEPRVHVYHTGVYYPRIAGIDVYASWSELVCQVGGE